MAVNWLKERIVNRDKIVVNGALKGDNAEIN